MSMNLIIYVHMMCLHGSACADVADAQVIYVHTGQFQKAVEFAHFVTGTLLATQLLASPKRVTSAIAWSNSSSSQCDISNCRGQQP